MENVSVNSYEKIAVIQFPGSNTERETIMACQRVGLNAVELLWEVSQVPEFSKTLTNLHEKLLFEIYKSILQNGRLENDFVSSQINRLNKTHGDIDTLMQNSGLFGYAIFGITTKTQGLLFTTKIK